MAKSMPDRGRVPRAVHSATRPRAARLPADLQPYNVTTEYPAEEADPTGVDGLGAAMSISTIGVLMLAVAFAVADGGLAGMLGGWRAPARGSPCGRNAVRRRRRQPPSRIPPEDGRSALAVLRRRRGQLLEPVSRPGSAPSWSGHDVLAGCVGPCR